MRSGRQQRWTLAPRFLFMATPPTSCPHSPSPQLSFKRSPRLLISPIFFYADCLMSRKRFKATPQKDLPGSGIFLLHFSGIPNTGIRHHLIKQTSGFNMLSIVECFLNYNLYGLLFFFFRPKPFTRPPPYMRFKAVFHYGGGRGWRLRWCFNICEWAALTWRVHQVYYPRPRLLSQLRAHDFQRASCLRLADI